MPSQNMSPREHEQATQGAEQPVVVWSRFPAGPYRFRPDMWLVERSCPRRYAVSPHGWGLPDVEGQPRAKHGSDREFAWFREGVDPNLRQAPRSTGWTHEKQARLLGR